MQRYWTWVAIPFLAIASPLLGHAVHLNVPLWRWEMLSLLAAVLLFSMVAAVLLMNGNRVGRLLLLAFVLLVSFDLQWSGHAIVAEIVHGLGYEGPLGPAAKVLGLAIILGVLFAVEWLLQRHIATVLLVYFAAATTVTIVTMVTLPHIGAVAASRRPSSRAADLAENPPHPPFLLHIVLDAMMSPAAMARDLPGADQAYKAINAFEKRFGFKSYRQVYSRYNNTFFGLSSMLNFVTAGTDVSGILGKRLIDGRGVRRVTKNRYFDRLMGRGYHIRVYQNTIFDYCGHSGVVYCHSQMLFDPLDEDVRSSMTIPVRMAHLVLDLTGSHSFTYWAARRVILHFDPTLLIFSGYGGAAAPSLLKAVTREAVTAPGGTAIFFHLLAPHVPYVWDKNCHLAKGDPAMHLFHGVSGPYGPGRINDEASRKARYRNYFGQVLCIFKKLTVLMDRLKAAGRLDDTLIIIHGDHGSRISLAGRHDNPANLSKRDLIDLYAAYFAIRFPHAKGGQDREFISLQSLFSRLFGPTDGGEPPATPPVVVQKLAPDRKDLSIPVAELPMPHFARQGSVGTVPPAIGPPTSQGAEHQVSRER